MLSSRKEAGIGEKREVTGTRREQRTPADEAGTSGTSGSRCGHKEAGSGKGGRHGREKVAGGQGGRQKAGG